jgi:hypothetical protein
MHGDDWNLDEHDRQEQQRLAAARFIPQVYSDIGRLDSADKTNLVNHGAQVYDDAAPFIVGKTIPRPGHGHCLYHSLNETNDIQIAIESRATLANYIHENENTQIGNLTFIESIRLTFGNSTQSTHYRDHMTGEQPFPDSAPSPPAGLQELIAFSLLHQRRIEVLTKVSGSNSDNLYRLQWSFGDHCLTSTRIVHNGSHFDNFEEMTAEPSVSPRREQPPSPDLFIGRKVLKEYGDSGWHYGHVISFALPSPTDSPETASLGILFHVVYEDKDEADYTLQQLQDIIVLPGFTDALSLPKQWRQLKNKYELIRAELIKHENDGITFEQSATETPFLKELLNFTRNGAITKPTVSNKAKEFFKILLHIFRNFLKPHSISSELYPSTLFLVYTIQS